MVWLGLADAGRLPMGTWSCKAKLQGPVSHCLKPGLSAGSTELTAVRPSHFEQELYSGSKKEPSTYGMLDVWRGKTFVFGGRRCQCPASRTRVLAGGVGLDIGILMANMRDQTTSVGMS